MYKRGLWPATGSLLDMEKADGDGALFDLLEGMIPNGHKIFYDWINKELDPSVFLADTGDDWNNDKEVWTRFFREAGSTVYHDYDAFRTGTKSGVFILPPKLDLSIMRTTFNVRDLLWRSYNFFYLGFDDIGSFACEKLFARGSTIMLTHSIYANQPSDALAVMHNVRDRAVKAGEENEKVTWKLAGSSNLVNRLSTLSSPRKEKTEHVAPAQAPNKKSNASIDKSPTIGYTRLFNAVVELQDLGAFVELNADDEDCDDAAADDFAVESLAVWAYGHDEGALVSRRSVVVVEDEGRGCTPRWRDAYQNLYIMGSGVPLAKFLNLRSAAPERAGS
jgi:hypothetical protein